MCSTFQLVNMHFMPLERQNKGTYLCLRIYFLQFVSQVCVCFFQDFLFFFSCLLNGEGIKTITLSAELRYSYQTERQMSIYFYQVSNQNIEICVHCKFLKQLLQTLLWEDIKLFLERNDNIQGDHAPLQSSLGFIAHPISQYSDGMAHSQEQLAWPPNLLHTPVDVVVWALFLDSCFHYHGLS